tara:strand:+ start:561 stop:710 length:150 start_codon:yes stop_codon:yes gene_type:complete
MEKISAWLFIIWAIIAIPQVKDSLGESAYAWIMVIVLAIIGIVELKAGK